MMRTVHTVLGIVVYCALQGSVGTRGATVQIDRATPDQVVPTAVAVRGV